jgi:hypothetical protein
MARILHTLPTTFFLSNWISEINKQQQKNGVYVCVCGDPGRTQTKQKNYIQT